MAWREEFDAWCRGESRHADLSTARRELYWHCLHCGEHVPAAGETALAHRKCMCGGDLYAVTLKMGAAYEQGLALGLPLAEAWMRALSRRGDGL